MTKSEKILQSKLKQEHFEDIIPLGSPIFRTVEGAMEEYAIDFHEKKLRIKKGLTKIEKYNQEKKQTSKKQKTSKK